MKKKGKKKGLIGTGTLIGAGVAALLIIFMLNPQWLPFSEKTTSKISELEQANFLIERSGHFTLAHFLTLLLAICVIWLFYTILKLIVAAVGKKNARTRTIASITLGGLKYLAVIAGVIWGLRILGVDTTAILAGVGIIGLILGFGAQSLIEERTPATTSRSSTTPTSATSRTVRATPRWRSASAASPTRPTCARSRRCSTRA